MKILLYVTSIHNTLNNGSEKDYRKLIENLEKIRELNGNDIVFICFCDHTENKNIMLYHARKMIEFMRYKKMYFGKQFLGDVHYNDLNSGAIIYEKKKLNKPEEITKYAKQLQGNGNEVELIVVDGNMDIDEYKKEIKEKINCPCSFIYNVFNISEINDTLIELYNTKIKNLHLEY